MSETNLTEVASAPAHEDKAHGSSDSVRASLRGFIEPRFPNVTVDDDQDIFATGLVNSLFAMELVLFIEKMAGARIPNSELAMNNFRSIDAMMRLALRIGPAPTGWSPS